MLGAGARGDNLRRAARPVAPTGRPMRPAYHPQLVNSPFQDPALYLDFLFARRALLFDLGDLHGLVPRKILRISDCFVSHTHMDHFIGFDAILRICLGRATTLRLYGPRGFIDRVGHRLAGYTWNLVESYETDFTVVAAEVDDGAITRTRFRCRTGFAPEPLDRATAPPDGLLLDEEGFAVRTAVLDHKIPCLAFAFEEKAHVNVWKNRLDEMGLPTGPWLQELKAAVRRGDADDTSVRAWWRADGRLRERHLPLGELRERVVRITRGQKIGYVVDALYSEDNAARIAALVRGADCLFIEAAFLHAEAERAAYTHHLTAHQAGLLARAAGVRAVVPFHYSARYEGRAQELYDEAMAAFEGEVGGRSDPILPSVH
jgi:ribonuclease Z